MLSLMIDCKRLSINIERILLFFMVFSLGVKVCAENWPDIPVHKKAKLIVVAEEMKMNGVEMVMWKLESFLSKEAMMSFYKEEWKKSFIENTPGYIEYEMGHWQVISRMEGGYQITVQFDREVTKSTDGLVGISKLPTEDNQISLGKGFPSVGNMEFLNDIYAVDQNKKSRTIVAVTDSSFNNSVNFYRRTYRRKGWEELTQNLTDEGDERIGLMFNRRGKELNLTIMRSEGKTNVVAVLVDH
ncbi:hypothetical protein [Marinibactrum halimedae]|uniref:Uncharacterized protein n=1 Tax=Marinibactrum halimedae TaxID=1444977 RepID=A0AA37T325_9GAMM|nr:hypothetical protein [Marinibactrum halimedae]MCD9460289.1 hypothetical protein [Marinibactrum halimedae]GLS24376.1 hypothetical protein GCM10007877_00870 [Marinibactrum halimedae]